MSTVHIKLDKSFTTSLNKLLKEYGEEFARIEGLGEKQLNLTSFIDNFVDTKTVSDASIDGNANVASKAVPTLLNEMSKPYQKLTGYNKIFYELNKKYGYKVADKWLRAQWEGWLYLHDAPSASYYSYCYAYDLKDLAEKGLYFIDNFNYEPPQHLGTFVDFVKEFVSYCSNSTSGACGMPNLIPYMYYFWKRDVTNGYYTRSPLDYAKQHIQRLVYALNQPFLRGQTQSAFTNVSIFDHKYLDALFGGAKFPDGSLMVEELEEIMEFQKVFLKTVAEIRSKNMMTFPVLSISLLKKDGKFKDEEFARWACEHNRKWNDSNFFVDSSVTSLSNCPLAGDTEILYWSDRQNKFILSPIKDVYNNNLRANKQTIKVLCNGQEITCKINKFDIPVEYEIELLNGAKIKTTANHLNKVYGRKDAVPTEELTVNDYLPYGRHPYEKSDYLTYEEGKLVGAFLGDGSYSDNGITYSLNSVTDRDFMDWMLEYIPQKYDGKCVEDLLTSSLSGGQLCTNFRIQSPYLLGLIKQFVKGDSALNKNINLRALNCSQEFRRGIIDGWYQTDGGNNNRIYTSSKDLVKSMNVIFASLGIVTKVNIDNREGRLSDNPCYTVRYYSPNGRSKLKDVYYIDKDYMWIKIKAITRCKNNSTTSYCLQVLDDTEPIFMLGNGIITHNCRLKNDIKDLYFNSIGGTALSVGSIKVNTINLAHIALATHSEQEYLTKLKEITELDLQCLDVVRHIILRNVEKGLLPIFSKGMIDEKHCYNTIGIIGVYETMKSFGYTREDEFGNVFYTEDAERFGKKIFDVIHNVKNVFSIDKDYKINCEAVPGESAAAKFLQKDKILYPNTVVEDLPLYGNQFIPLGIKTTLQERIRIAAMFDGFCNGGSILHINVDAPFDSTEKAWDMLNYVTDMGVTYFAFTGKIQACEKNHAFYGKKCPVCGGEVATEYSRIVGFWTPVRTYSKERKAEWKMRQWENING